VIVNLLKDTRIVYDKVIPITNKFKLFLVQKLGLFLIVILICEILPAFSEEYYYTNDVPPLTSPPVFCAVRFSDPNISDANEKMYELTKKSVFDWRSKLLEYTGNVKGWDFKYKEVNSWELDENRANLGCDVPIYFTTTYYFEEDERGVTEYYTDGSTTITISYVSAFIDVKKIVSNPNSINSDPKSNVVIDKNKIAPDVEAVIKHEIGHVLRLSHPSLNPNDFEFSSKTNQFIPPSIMFSPANLNEEILDKLLLDITRDHPELEPMDFATLMYSGVSSRILQDIANKIFNSPTSSEIHDYDIRSVVNLYGIDGISIRNDLPTDSSIKSFPCISNCQENIVNSELINSVQPNYTAFIIFIIILSIVVYTIIKIRKIKTKYYSNQIRISKVQPKTTIKTAEIDDSYFHSKKCPFCNRRLTNFDKPRKCNNCGNFVT